MTEPKILKTITPIDCPHCKKTICVGFQSMIPSLTSVVTLEEVQEAKDEIAKKLDEIKFKKEEDKKKIISWLEAESTIIDKSDVESILKQIVNEQSQEEKK